VETFTEPRPFMENARYEQDRERALAVLDLASIDAPIVDIVAGFAALPHCFTLQCCYGHFICRPGQGRHTLDPIPPGHGGPVRYRIAYLVLSFEDGPRGRALRDALAGVPAVDPSRIEFGSADWFWERWLNSYALQVEPLAWRLKDEAILQAGEARNVEKTRDLFFEAVRVVLAAELSDHATG
jgi:hypothetical protein